MNLNSQLEYMTRRINEITIMLIILIIPWYYISDNTINTHFHNYSMFPCLKSNVTIHIRKLNIFGLLSFWSYVWSLWVSVLFIICFSMPLDYASDDESLAQSILKCGVKKGVYKKIATRVKDDKKLVDGDCYLDPLLAVIITTLLPNFFESSEIKKLIYVQYDSQCMAENKYYDDWKQNKCLFNVIRLVSPFSARGGICALWWLP